MEIDEMIVWLDDAIEAAIRRGADKWFVGALGAALSAAHAIKERHA